MLKVPIETGEIYHVYSKSIAEFVIFNNDAEFLPEFFSQFDLNLTV